MSEHMQLVGKKSEVLRSVALPLTPDELSDPATARLADRLVATCRIKGGIAIAAPQVGVSKRLVVTWDGAVWANPTIELDDEEVEEATEGCLSLPGRTYVVARPTRCNLTATGLDGVEVTVDLENLEARMVQHEIDHLDGILISDRGREVFNAQATLKF